MQKGLPDPDEPQPPGDSEDRILDPGRDENSYLWTPARALGEFWERKLLERESETGDWLEFHQRRGERD